MFILINEFVIIILKIVVMMDFIGVFVVIMVELILIIGLIKLKLVF